MPVPHAYRSRVSQAEQVDINETSSHQNPVPRIARLGDRAFAAILDAFIPMPLLFAINTLQALRLEQYHFCYNVPSGNLNQA
jgi:hypothetical protein